MQVPYHSRCLLFILLAKGISHSFHCASSPQKVLLRKPFRGPRFASFLSLAVPFVYTFSKRHLSFIPLRLLSPRQNKFRIIRGNFSLIFFEKLPLIHFTVLSLPKMFFCKKHFGGPSIVIFCGTNFFREPRFASFLSLAVPFVYTLSKRRLSFISLRLLSPRQNKFRIIRGNFSLIFFEKLPLIHFTVLSLPKMFFCKKHFGAPPLLFFVGQTFSGGVRFVAAEHV